MLHFTQTKPETPDESFLLAMRQLAASVAVVTAGEGDDRNGFTATSVISLSVTPPTLLVSVDRRSSSLPLILGRKGFTVNFLALDQSAVADRFAGRTGARGSERFEGADWIAHPGAGFGLLGATAVVHCELEETIERHTHLLLLGAVLSTTVTPAAPLVHWNRSYQGLEGL